MNTAALSLDYSARVKAANDAADAKDYATARTLLDSLIAEDPYQTDIRIRQIRVLTDLKAWDEAYRQCVWVLAVEPYNPAVLDRMAYICACRGDHDEALRYAAEALRVAPNSALTHFNRSHWLLKEGRWQEGWDSYRWRNAHKIGELRMAQPEWNGEALKAGQTLYIGAEQGFGDTIQQIRLVGAAWQHAARDLKDGEQVYVTLEVQAGLLPLFASLSSAVVRVVAQQPGVIPVGRFDAWVNLFTLPAILGLDSPEAFAAAGPMPYIDAAPCREIDRTSGVLNVGLCWRGNAEFPGDRDRSIYDLDVLRPLVSLSSSGVRFHCLMPDAGKEDAERRFIEDFGIQTYKLLDFAATASVIAACDVVVTTCTSVAHLAGAMGAKTLLMLQRNADWRWLTERTDTPLYPSVTLVRQETQGDWSSVVEEVRVHVSAERELPWKREAEVPTPTHPAEDCICLLYVDAKVPGAGKDPAELYVGVHKPLTKWRLVRSVYGGFYYASADCPKCCGIGRVAKTGGTK